MSQTTTRKLTKSLLFLYLAIFPFGQIPSLLITFLFHTSLSVHLTDILVFLYVLIIFLTDKKIRNSFLYSAVCKACVVFIFSFLFGSVFLNQLGTVSFLYLLRICSYLSFSYILWKVRPLTKHELKVFLIISALFISILGLLQYAFLPDTRFLKAYGWDDHYYRLISTFLDPAYTAILLVFSFLFTAFGWKTDNRLLKFSSLGIITISLLLTYSRASYLALFFGVVVYSIKSEKIKLKYLLFTVLFVLSLFFLPRAVGGEGVHLERTFSLFLKIQNSVDTLKLTQASPLFGVGYNYLCAARVSLEGVQSLALYSHSCSGADNSLVFIYSTLGTVGVIFILWQLYRFAKKFDTPLLFGVFAALVFHTQFTNTIFYPWVFMWVVFLVLLETD